jgi:hypothetical protein
VFSELAGEEVTGEQTDVAGLPALRYEFGPSRPAMVSGIHSDGEVD